MVDIRISLGVNHYTEAAQEFKHAVARDPRNAQAHFDLALCYFRLRQPDEAIKELQAALALEPWYTRAEELLVDIYLQKKGYAQARERLQHLLSIDPRNCTAHTICASSPPPPGAGTKLSRNCFLHSIPILARRRRTIRWEASTLGAASLTRSELEEAIRLQPEFAWAYYNLVLVSKKQEKRDEATQELRLALKADPQFHAARAELDRMEGSMKR